MIRNISETPVEDSYRYFYRFIILFFVLAGLTLINFFMTFSFNNDLLNYLSLNMWTPAFSPNLTILYLYFYQKLQTGIQLSINIQIFLLPTAIVISILVGTSKAKWDESYSQSERIYSRTFSGQEAAKYWRRWKKIIVEEKEGKNYYLTFRCPLCGKEYPPKIDKDWYKVNIDMQKLALVHILEHIHRSYE